MCKVSFKVEWIYELFILILFLGTVWIQPDTFFHSHPAELDIQRSIILFPESAVRNERKEGRVSLKKVTVPKKKLKVRQAGSEEDV